MKRLILICWLVLLALSVHAQSETPRPVVEIGVVLDGPQPLQEGIREQLLQELAVLTAREFDVRFPEDREIIGDGTVAAARRGLNALYRDRAVHIVIAGGPIASQAVLVQARQGDGLSKPTIAPIVLDVGLQDAPLHQGASGIHNLSYIVFPSDVRSDVQVFRQVVEFERLGVVVDSRIHDALPELSEKILATIRELGVQAVIVPATADVDALLNRMTGVDAVYFAHLLPLPSDEVRVLAEGLIDRGLPSFANHAQQVEQGMLVSLRSMDDRRRLLRRVALNIQSMLLGEPAAKLPVVLQRTDRLTLNDATVRRLNLSPSWSVMTEAVLVNQAEVAVDRSLSLTSTIREAVDRSRDLVAQQRSVDAGRAAVAQARARLLPQVEAAATAVVLDDALGSPQQAERQTDASLQLTQVIYSDEARAGWQAEAQLQRGRESALAKLRLDVIQAAASAYLNLLRAQTLERVQKENLDLTRSNLELARVRQQIGISGPAEVHRWESQIATARKAVIDANARRNVAQIEVNRVLDQPLESDFGTMEAGLFDDGLATHDPRFTRFIANKRNFRAFRDFMTEDGLSTAPELVEIDAAIAARRRLLTAAGRAHWLPTLALQGDLTRNVSRDGVGAEFDPAGGESTWSVGLRASLPLFSGGGKFAAQARARHEVRQLEEQRAGLAQRLGARIRAALHAAGASYAGISLSEDAAVASARNLELVEDAYGRGVLSILDLLDAQNAAIVAEQTAANAVYDFLLDQMEVERSIGKSYLYAPDEDREVWFQRATHYLEQAHTRVADPEGETR
ncbi:MAG: TolC family protein [Gemmatimonadetes bacterium]|jgi:outer membrane protein|nr:TolC family protein [Gemmatimonadota bacterium]MBT6147276.1 TolC family protein [Gemmatimonadota bacterium]MBT7862523.1 TolC family protein [Gemmatimonadota bacterium]